MDGCWVVSVLASLLFPSNTDGLGNARPNDDEFLRKEAKKDRKVFPPFFLGLGRCCFFLVMIIKVLALCKSDSGFGFVPRFFF